ncbi:hypothetical protein ASPZODRAFT_12783 [Penicilliopsis zonata CBS 506.65]|uniref:DUF3824 domain-containing protein n=1 Tax=Penicilliopsis zonata CBS 506.65 TaxID=1073090 RepID=A0A1L9SRA7_9EURO|nr:hypothetical protein ASPZODRAFT_12783 [Penicilliopsis zonata CBS 506.65]OJJ49663.1 hypothetical protein ASPZODRAFT_12783 [Penicilliopsis zonata CBS 506.65]
MSRYDRYEYPPYAHGARHSQDLVRHQDDSTESVEEIQRDYPPGEYDEYGYGPPRRTRVTTVRDGVRRTQSVNSSPRGTYYYESTRYEGGGGGGGGGGGRRPRESRESREFKESRESREPRESRHSRRYYNDRSSRYSSASRSPPPSSSRRYGKGSSRHHRSYSYSPSPTRSKSRHTREKDERIAQAVKAALTAGAAEAFRLRNEPGDWKGAKGRRILTAAIAAGGTDGILDRNNPEKHSTRHIIESTLAGLAANRLVNGPRSRSQSRSKSRHRSKSRGGSGALKDVAATGLLAAAGKEIYDHVRNRSRSRSRPAGGRGRSSSRNSGAGDHRGSSRRSKSVSEYINKGLAALGLGESSKNSDAGGRRDKDMHDRDHDHDRPRRRQRRRHLSDSEDSGSSWSSDEDSRDDRGRSRRGDRHHSREVISPSTGYSSTEGGRGNSRLKKTKKKNNDSHTDSDSDLGDSSDEKKQDKKLRRDTLLTTGLATVATIHAAHSVYKGYEGRKKRKKEVEEGEMTPQEAHKLRVRANLADAASVGLAALGVKGAVGEWKEVLEKKHERDHYHEECAHRHEKRSARRSQSSARPSQSSALQRRNTSLDGDRPLSQGFHYYDGNPASVRVSVVNRVFWTRDETHRTCVWHSEKYQPSPFLPAQHHSFDLTKVYMKAMMLEFATDQQDHPSSLFSIP